MANKICKKCGKDITYGINGCMLMDVCFECHGGFPKYTLAREANSYSWDDIDALEDRCINDGEE